MEEAAKINKTPTQQKRRPSEYRDPDYSNEIQIATAKNDTKRTKLAAISNDNNAGLSKDAQERRFKILRDVIKREFQKEIDYKYEELDKINERLLQASYLLERLRFAIVSDYYKKQEVPLKKPDVDAVRGKQTLFTDEPIGPQMPLHPSIKRLIGKKPLGYNELVRSQPERSAAAQAIQTIRSRNPANRRKEMRMQKIIREQGIVIDHSKEEQQFVPNNLIKSEPSIEDDERPCTSKYAQEQSNRMTATVDGAREYRAPTKTKHLFVVANTSKYIDNVESTLANDFSNITKCTHKWLIYVQCKDVSTPVETYIKKVRFHLHQSYRPNDIVDVVEPPFQLTRRGWGEFPMRLQLYFHDHFHQKPVQLIHNLVLDKTLSGLHTIGAETIIEVWLRSASLNIPEIEETKEKGISPIGATGTINKDIIKWDTVDNTPMESSKPRTISITQNKEDLDDTLFECLNKIELSSDIEKIEPTVFVSEPLACKMKLFSPRKQEPLNTNDSSTKFQNSDSLDKADTITTLVPSSSIQTTTTICANFAPNTNMLCNTSTNKVNVTKSVETRSVKTHSEISGNAVSVQKPNPPSTTVMFTQPQNTLIDSVPKSSTIINQINNKAQPSVESNEGTQQMPPILKQPTSATKPTIIYLPTSNTSSNALGNNNQANKSSTVLNAPRNTVFINGRKLILTNPIKLSATANPKALAPVITPANSKQQFVRLVNAQGKVSIVPMVIKTPMQNPDTKAQVPSKENKVTPTLNTKLATNVVMPSPPNTINSYQVANVNGTQLAELKPPPVVGTRVTKTCKNVVFQKEGKVYIIDPLQTKLKQQQKKQQSLLKPQISLLKLQRKSHEENSLTTTTFTTTTVPAPIVQSYVSDHDYAPAPPSVTKPVETTVTIMAQQTESAAEIHLGALQRRINAETMQISYEQHRNQLEKSFQNINFTSMRAALDFLLRRLPLVAPKGTLASFFPYTCRTLAQFNAYSAIQQRSREWMRVRYIQRCLKSHKQLVNIEETCWSSREIAMYARYHAYTPQIKSLETIVKPESTIRPTGKDSKPFATLVKSELRDELQPMQYETLSSAESICNWVDGTTEKLTAYEHEIEDNELIDVLAVDSGFKTQRRASPQNASPEKIDSGDTMLYMPISAALEPAKDLVEGICRETTLKLKTEEIVPGVLHPAAMSCLAQSLKVFVERLTRQTIATKFHLQQQQKEQPKDGSSSLPLGVGDMVITPQDIGRMIAQNKEFEFLTNSHMGLQQKDIEPKVK